jgi:very-short-patch-repair endonuclease
MEKPNPTNHYLHNPGLTGYAKRMRTKGTKAEAYLWKFGLKNRVMGYKFLRQRPVMSYIADFMCPELRLIIETDGSSHLLEGAAEKDQIRQQNLEKAGFTVLRFEDSMVLNNLGVTLSIIEQEVEKLAAKRKLSSPLA